MSDFIHPLLEGLNPPQREAVTTLDGPVLLLAGAGSGKTKTLTHRIAYMIQSKKLSPFNVLAVTFTNKAASEMKKRIVELMVGKEQAGRLLGNKGPSSFYRTDVPVLGTFHSVCVQILRRSIHLLGYENRFAIYDDTDSEILMKTIMKDLAINSEKINPRAVLSHISGAKNALLSPSDYARQVYGTFSERVAELYPIYQKRLAQNQALDFDDLIMKTVELFDKEPKLLDELQERFISISVDEYQDTNHAQYVLIKRLAEKYRNLCVVGDDWQSIYSWRGATMKNILDFEKDYPESKVIKLEQNYRSTSLILNASHAVISKNKKRTDKKLWTDREGGEKIQVWCTADERDEGTRVAQEIQRLLLQHESPHYADFAVLYRTNAQSRVVEEAMLRHGIPYRVVGGVRFYQRKEIKDIVSYLRLILNPADSISLLRIVNTPPRKIGSTTLERLQDLSRQRGEEPLFSVMRDIETIGKDQVDEGKIFTLKSFVDLIAGLQKINEQYPASGVIKHLISESKYKEFVLDGTPEGQSRFENVQELISVASKYDALEPGISLATFLEEISLVSDLDQLDERDNAVVLMTLHSAKGLEFRTVFICGLEEGVFPHSRSLFEPNELEEERRLLYVGLTRAMERLYLLHAERRLLYGEIKHNAPSQFLKDIPENLCQSEERGENGSILSHYLGKNRGMSGLKRVPVEKESGFYPDEPPSYSLDQTDEPPLSEEIAFLAGDRVRHRSFGEGVVIQVTGGILTVAFHDAHIGVKKLVASVAPLKKLS